ncbi:MAG: hypothetical protein HYV97_08795 [Bdellovibrio sp.]|nr:hypothetical protein [Bdellovibrio sp.]
MGTDSQDKNTYYPLSEEELLREKLSGMTVNERLVETQQLNAFAEAKRNKDVKVIRKILESIFVDEESIKKILSGSCS